MATAIRHTDAVEDALVAVDRAYLDVYGPGEARWPRHTRGEYFAELAQARRQRTMFREHLPQHPRRASAGTRRHHRKYLTYRVRQLVPGAHTVLLTPVWTDALGHGPEISFMALVRDVHGQSLKLPRGASRQLAAWMQGAFADVDWRYSHTWRADTNTLLPLATESTRWAS